LFFHCLVNKTFELKRNPVSPIHNGRSSAMNEPDAAADALGRRQAISLRSELASAKDEVAAGRSGFGEHHMTAAVRGASPAEVDAAVAEVQATLADLGIIAVREEIALEPAFWVFNR
jgi:type IV secretory pathway VirB4 component